MDFDPAKCYSLLESHLGQAIPLTSDLTTTQAAKAALMASFLKKWEPENSQSLEDVAIDAFLRSNQRCRDFVIPDAASSYEGQIVEAARAALHALLNDGPLQTCKLSLSSCLDRGRPGPGSSIHTRGRNDFYRKTFAGVLTTTHSDLHAHYVHGLSSTWLTAELHRWARHGVEVVEGSNLSTVLKNSKTNRTICTEASLNMFYQLGAASILEDVLVDRHNIDVSVQPKWNRMAAREGSVRENFVTVDLTDASNSISCLLVRHMLPRHAAWCLEVIRSPKTRVRGEWVELSMISSMGNGFTFPLMTLLLAELVRATYVFLGITPKARGLDRNYGVFGDDIVCVPRAYPMLQRVLQCCGFSVNSEKSFASGPFRESCGGDYFRGVDVRGVYLRKVNHETDIYSVFNRLARWSAKHRVDISRCLLYLKSLVKNRPVPFDVGDVAGIKTPRSQLMHLKYSLLRGWQYHRYEPRPVAYKVPFPGDIEMGPQKPADDVEWNPEGVLVAHIGGFLQGGCCSVRVETTAYKVVKEWTHSWDFISHPGLSIRDFEHVWLLLELQRLEAAS